MTTAEARRIKTKLNRVDRIVTRLDAKVDDVKEEILKLKMELQEIRDELTESVPLSPSRGAAAPPPP